jgi:hypothetical protein
MPIESDWGSESQGAEAQKPAQPGASYAFQGYGKNLNKPQFEQHVKNVMASTQAAGPVEQQRGKNFYPMAHELAKSVGRGVDPSGALEHGTPGHVSRDYFTGNTSALKEEIHDPTNTLQESRLKRGAGAISALSPAMPYEQRGKDDKVTSYNNAQAAHELHGVGEGEMTEIQRGNRAPLTGNPARANLNRQSGANISKAHDILNGYRDPDTAFSTRTKAARLKTPTVPGGEPTVKTGAFYGNIVNPTGSQRATVDGRSHDIAVGEELAWKTNRGLGAQGRYDYLEQVHQEAAKRMGMRPHEVQAISWLADKKAMTTGQTDKQNAIGMGAKRHSQKPVGQEGMPNTKPSLVTRNAQSVKK